MDTPEIDDADDAKTENNTLAIILGAAVAVAVVGLVSAIQIAIKHMSGLNFMRRQKIVIVYCKPVKQQPMPTLFFKKASFSDTFNTVEYLY